MVTNFAMVAPLPHHPQLQALAPTVIENLAHALRFSALELRIFFQPRQGFLARFDQQARVAGEIGQVKI